MSEEAVMIDAEGNFTDEFRAAVPGYLGDEHKDSKALDDINTLGDLVKSHAATKSAYGKKLENVIQKPAEDADDEQKAEYHKALATELGAPDNADKYEFFRADKELPKGMLYSEKTQEALRECAFKHGVSAAFIKEASEVLHKSQVQELKDVVAKQNDDAQKIFDEQSTSLKTAWAGDDLAKNSRIALKALQEFASDELKELLKKEGVYEKASDLSVWRNCGIDPDQIRIWHNIGMRSLSAEVLQNEGVKGGTGGETEKEKMKRLYPNSPEMWPK
jgi:hypothetical protein